MSASVNGRFKGILVQCGPWGLEGESDFLYHNRGDGTFEEVSVKAGVHDDIGYYGLAVMWTDYDDHGWPDLLVANDSVPNYHPSGVSDPGRQEDRMGRIVQTWELCKRQARPRLLSR